LSNVVILLETKDASTLRPACLQAITLGRELAQALGIPFSLALLGHNIRPLAELVLNYGAERVFVVDDPVLGQPLAERVAPSLQRVVELAKASFVVGAATAFGKDVLPRLAELLDAAYVGDCTKFELEDGNVIWCRPILAGNANAYCTATTPLTVATVRHAELQPASKCEIESPVEFITAAPPDPEVDRVEFIGLETVKNSRPDVAEARVVISGGRPLNDRFFDVLGPLADVLDAGLGATRAVCDAGHAPGDYQVGQTGKVVAPDLYIAVGISGAIQHTAGIRGAKVIVAINSDPEAPIMSVADYALVGNLFELVPEIVAELQARKRDS
jgi:electron transfer flavoprotein alpha subunit